MVVLVPHTTRPRLLVLLGISCVTFEAQSHFEIDANVTKCVCATQLMSAPSSIFFVVDEPVWLIEKPHRSLCLVVVSEHIARSSCISIFGDIMVQQFCAQHERAA